MHHGLHKTLMDNVRGVFIDEFDLLRTGREMRGGDLYHASRLAIRTR